MAEKKKVLLISAQGIGNTILAMPVFLSLKMRGHRLDLVVSDNGSSELSDLMDVANKILIWKEAWPWFQNIIVVYFSLLFVRYDAAYALSPSGKRENLLLRLVRAKKKCGWRSAAKRRLLSFTDPKMPFWNEREHDLNSNRILTGLDEYEVGSAIVSFEEKLRAIGSEREKDTGMLRLGIHLFSGWRAKGWPVEKFRDLLIALKARFQLQVCIFGIISNEHELRQWVKELPMAVELKISLPWHKIIEEMKRLDFFIGVDSSLCHLSAILGIPTCILYSYSVPERTAALGDHVLIIQTNYSCCPCYQFTSGYFDDCIYHLRCIQNLDVRDVLHILSTFMGRLGRDPTERICEDLELDYTLKWLPFGARLLSIQGRDST